MLAARAAGAALGRRLLSGSPRSLRPLIKEGGDKQLPITGPFQGDRMNPEFWTWDKDSGERSYFYREDWTMGPKEYALGRLGATIIVAYIAYQFYWRSHLYTGGPFYLPDPAEFTDSELGIPPDDGPDPAYWGPQQPMGYGQPQ